MEAPRIDRDVVVVGGGVNGLICALLLARSGLSVEVVEERPLLGGMHRTEFPFAKAPRLPAFTGAHRVGFVPAELITQLALPSPFFTARDPSVFVPTKAPGRYLLGGRDGLKSTTGGVVSDQDARAIGAMFAELDLLVADLAPAWMTTMLSVEEISARHVRPELRDHFVALCRGSLSDYLERFGIRNDIVRATLAADALDGSFSSWDAPGSGAPLLVRHAACSAGDALVSGGLGALARSLGELTQAAGATITTTTAVTQILVVGNTATGVVLADGRTINAGAVVTSADPWRLRALVGTDLLPAEYSRRIEAFARPGGVAKLNVAFTKLPTFACLPDDRGQHRATTFILPGAEGDAMNALARAFTDASSGNLPLEPVLECVFPSAADESLRDADGHHSASILVPWAPYDLAGTTWSAAEERFTNVVLDILEAVAPGARSLVADAVLAHPKKIETQFGVTRGQLGHIDDTFLFGDRLSPTTPISALYLCGRGCGPAGRVFGVAGLNAFRRVLADVELGLERTEVGIRDDS